MAFDGLVTFAVTAELNKKILNSKIEKIYQPEPEELVFHLHASSGNYKLYISAASSHAGIHLARESFSNPQNPMSFCMLLRKHLQGGRIVSITQINGDRIIEFGIETLNELGFCVNKKMIVEIMGKHSNVIITDAESGKITDSIKRVSIDVNRVRQLLPGKIYEYPPAQDKIPFMQITKEELAERLPGSALPSSKQLLSVIRGIAPAVSERLAIAAENSPENDPLSAVARDIEAMQKELAEGSCFPRIYYDENNVPYDFHIFDLPAGGLYKCVEFDSVSEAVEQYFLGKSSSNRLRQRSSDLERALHNVLDKLYLKKQRLLEDLHAAENSENYRLFGELLTANIHAFKTGDATVKLLNYYDGQMIEIPLDVRFSPSKNAQIYFKKYGKAKTAVKEKKLQLEEAQSDIDYLESVMTFAENAASIEEMEELRNELVENGYMRRRKNNYAPKKKKNKPYEYTVDGGVRVLVGRNNTENDLLTFKTAGNRDIWFHTKDIPGSHVIAFTNGNELSEKALFEAAALAAYYSKGRSSENVPVDYVRVKYVKKPNGAKPGMVIFTNNRTLYVNPKLPEGETE
ncbi:MAG: NFACT family protein [Clostridia bacterium]|nr:NFACT family protein [Clostridia bacterium]